MTDALLNVCVSSLSPYCSKAHAAVLRHMISNTSSVFPPQHYSALHSLQGGASASSQVLVMGPDDLIVSLSWYCKNFTAKANL